MTQREEPLVAEENGLGENQNVPVSKLDRYMVPIVFTIFVLFRAIDRVFSKSLTNELHRSSYNLIWFNILWPLAIQIMTVCMMAGYILVQRQMGNRDYDWKFFLPGNPMASAMGAVPLYQLALFSLGDQVNAALQSPAGPFVSQALQSTMTNAVLIWMAIIAFFWIGARFKQVHLVGMALVMMACLVQLSTQFTSSDCSEKGLEAGNCLAGYWSVHGGDDGKGGFVKLTSKAMLFWLGLFFISTLPAAFGNVYKQKVLQGRDVDVFYATWWSGNAQVVWGWLCIPLLWIQLPGQDFLAPQDTLTEIGNTLTCIGGGVARPGDEGYCTASPPPWVWMTVYLCFNITFNMAMLWLVKRMSAAWAQVATVLCLNLCNIFSTIKAINGSSAQPMSFNDWLGAIIVSIALWVYNIEEETTADSHKKTQKIQGSFVSDGHANTLG